MDAKCPRCGEELDAESSLAGQEVKCPTCAHEFRLAATPPPPVSPPPKPPERKQSRSHPETGEVKANVKQTAAIAGWICFGLGIVFMFLSVLTFFFYVPLFFAAFVLSIIAMTQGRIVSGVILLLLNIILPPCLWLGLVASYRSDSMITKLKEDNAVTSPCEDAASIKGQGRSSNNRGTLSIDRAWATDIGGYRCAYAMVTWENTSTLTFNKVVTIQAIAYDSEGRKINANERSLFARERGAFPPGFKGSLKIPVELEGATFSKMECFIIVAQ